MRLTLTTGLLAIAAAIATALAAPPEAWARGHHTQASAQVDTHPAAAPYSR